MSEMKQNPVTFQWSGEYDAIGQKIPEIKENHKYIGFHNQKEVVSFFGPNKTYAEKKCKELLLNYFHTLQDNVTRFPLDYYNGIVAYVGMKK